MLGLDHAQDLISVRSCVADHHGFLGQRCSLLLSSLRSIFVVHGHWAKCRLPVRVDLIRHLGEAEHLAPVLLGWRCPCLDRGPGRLSYVDSGSLQGARLWLSRGLGAFELPDDFALLGLDH